MKIAFIAPLEEPIPPVAYGGIEWIVYELVHGLAARGHEIDLYATGDSQATNTYHIIPTAAVSLRNNHEIGTDIKTRETAKWFYLGKLAKQLENTNYDIIHNHYSWRFLIQSPVITSPILTTIHGPLNLPYQNFVFHAYKSLPYVSISDNQRNDIPELNYTATIYNGLDLTRFPFYAEVTAADNYLLFFARFSPEKGGLEAIQAAKHAQKPLKIGAKVDLVDQDYFAKAKPFIDEQLISFMGEVGQEEKDKAYQHARALLVPIMWEEPFGLMFTESMSCGTPVITFSRGSAPEVIRDGVTGFLVNQSDEYVRGDWIIKKTGVEGLVEAINRIYAMPEEEYKQMRRNCREHVEKKFTNHKMVDAYEKVYQQIIQDKK